MTTTDLTYDDTGNPREDMTTVTRTVPVAPLDTIESALLSENVVEDVRTHGTSDFIYGTMVEVEVVEGCSFHVRTTLRDLGLFIEYVENYGDTEVLKCRRISRLLERMEQDNRFRNMKPHPEEVRE